MTLARSIYHARLMYLGVAMGAGGVAFYTPLILSEVGKSFSGMAAALILFGANLGRVLGSHYASRHTLFINHPVLIVSNILLEGAALYGMIYASQPWAYALLALLAGIGSGLSLPALKNYLLKLKDLDIARAFAGLALSLRMGMTLGYLGGALVAVNQMQLVFTVIFGLFVGYAVMMHFAMRAINRHPTTRAAPSVRHSASDQRHANMQEGREALADIGPTFLLICNVVFYFLSVQPTIGYSLYIPQYVASISVSLPFWINTLTVLIFQMYISRRAKSLRWHMRFVLLGYASLGLSFLLMALAGQQPLVLGLGAVLLAFGQIFFIPSFDFLASQFVEKSRMESGQLMARQHFYQSVGVMGGSIVAGALFDLGQFFHSPALMWAVLALTSFVMLVLLKRKLH